MADKPKITQFKRTCTACPSQWEGKLADGQYFYARYRWGSFGYGIGSTLDKAIANCGYTDVVGVGFDGYMTDEKMKELASKYMDFTDAKQSEEGKSVFHIK